MKGVVAELVASLAFALFVMCPRLAGMCAAIADLKGLDPYLVAFLGTLMAAPLLALMMYLTLRCGVGAAIIAAVATDVAAALVMGTLDYRALVELLVIAAFIWVGVVVAKWAVRLTWAISP